MPPPNGEVIGAVRLSKGDWVRIIIALASQAIALGTAGVGFAMSLNTRMVRQEERWSGTTMLLIEALNKGHEDHEVRLRHLERLP